LREGKAASLGRGGKEKKLGIGKRGKGKGKRSLPLRFN